jgi:lipopolysaccharide export system protein LptA
MSASRMSCRLYLAVVIAFALGCPATAQGQGAPKDSTTSSTVTGPPNALQGFSQNRDKPIQIDAARLEVRDKDKVATFFGDAKADVKVIQGDVTMRSKVLVVFYEQDEPAKAGAAKTAKAAAPGPGGSSQIKRLEAKGNVVVTQKDQTVTGENGLFDMKSNTVTMTGSVIMTQCDNVLKGDRLVVDLTTGVSKVDGGRVQGLLLQSKTGCGSAATPPAPGPAKQAPSAPKGPLPLSGSR